MLMQYILHDINHQQQQAGWLIGSDSESSKDYGIVNVLMQVHFDNYFEQPMEISQPFGMSMFLQVCVDCTFRLLVGGFLLIAFTLSLLRNTLSLGFVARTRCGNV